MFKGVNCATYNIVSCSILFYCDLFWSVLLLFLSTLGDLIVVLRVVERFIRHIVHCCLLVIHILNKLISVPKTNCVLFTLGVKLGNYTFFV